MKLWLERINIPSYAVTHDMQPNLSAIGKDYQTTKVFAACIPAQKLTHSLKAFNFADLPDPEFQGDALWGAGRDAPRTRLSGLLIPYASSSL